ncbi:MAG: SpoIVB peptidase [Ruminococcaceae bacterium]|nr:SpoIVB peptidase [Oscillospiraceae bacterium]
MKTMRFLAKSIFYICLIFAILIFSSVIYLNNSVSREFKIKKGDTLSINSFIPVTSVYNGEELSQSGGLDTVGKQYDVDLKIFGIIPVSTVSVEVVDEMHVSVLGQPFGMKIYTDGVLVIDTSDVETKNGTINPAQKAGIKKGDYIISVNGTNIYTNEDLSEVVQKSGGESMNFVIKRKNKKIHTKVTAVLSKETESYKIGIWIRDSSAGIGTLTFYSPATEVVCGLGHGICDEDTGTLLELNTGEIVNAEIISVEKGEKGSPGQLKGRFGYKTLGDIDLNCNGGVYSILEGRLDTSNLTEIALKQEISSGNAQIYCTVDGEKPKYYECEVEIRTSAYMSKTQNMIVTVTDQRLLDLTGGIVQGMSGSPIIQNGKLIGALTHVLVDDPEKGYAIFAENMLETAQGVAEDNKLKDAS